jgi:hypothetical protein
VGLDTILKRVTLVSGKGALGTWRSQAGQRRVSEEPAFSDEPEGKQEMSGVYASQRLSFLMFRKAFRGKPGSEPYSGNPTVRDRRGACGNVDASRARRSSIPTPPGAGVTAYPPGLRLALNGLQRGETAEPGSLHPGIPSRRHLWVAQAKVR